uniref:Uncharacterized protein n=1 Tax=Amazona collaria TaxID=241587 RepID=A0A8B9ISZ3_9PSIT
GGTWISYEFFLVNQFGSLNTVSNAQRKKFERLKRFRSPSPAHYQWNFNSLRSLALLKMECGLLSHIHTSENITLLGHSTVSSSIP